jgi:hypothetical protein
VSDDPIWLAVWAGNGDGKFVLDVDELNAHEWNQYFDETHPDDRPRGDE